MVHIIKTEGPTGKPLYYIYDNVFDHNTAKYKKVYIGPATENEYLQYQESKKSRKKHNFCNKCGKRKKHSIPQYILKKIPYCQCT